MKINMHSLTEKQWAARGTPLTQENPKCSVSNHKPQKAPGPNSFTGDFNKIYFFYISPYVANLSPYVANLFYSYLEGAAIPEKMNTAYSKVLPKQGRDLTLAASYRPISMINVDLKLIFKIMADRLASILPEFIFPNQVWFVQGRVVVSNIRKAWLYLMKLLLKRYLIPLKPTVNYPLYFIKYSQNLNIGHSYPYLCWQDAIS